MTRKISIAAVLGLLLMLQSSSGLAAATSKAEQIEASQDRAAQYEVAQSIASQAETEQAKAGQTRTEQIRAEKAKAPKSKNAFKSTPYPVPRFVSLAKGKVYVRSGPGAKYPIKFIFKKKHLPVEVILEYEVWRKVRDHEGDEGWVHQSLTSGKRGAVMRGAEPIELYSKPKDGARLVARAQPGAAGRIEECRETHCRVDLSGYKGWVKKGNVWGVYEDETFD